MAPGPSIQDRDRLLSTGKVARLLSVTPDAVLKWIKSGRLRAVRTAGGHYRVAQHDLDCLISDGVDTRSTGDGGFLYCWEYFATDGAPGEKCQGCLVYRARARRCFEISSLAEEVGYAGAYCTNSCEGCDYYRDVVGRRKRVLIVTDSDELRRLLLREHSGGEVEIEFAGSEYECSAAAAEFRPEYVVIDGSLPKSLRSSLHSHLASDPRIPGVRIIPATAAADEFPADGSMTGVDCALPRTFCLQDLEDHIRGLEVKPAVRA